MIISHTRTQGTGNEIGLLGNKQGTCAVQSVAVVGLSVVAVDYIHLLRLS
jgi:hypothetical protein